jgi:hypothetical protein
MVLSIANGKAGAGPSKPEGFKEDEDTSAHEITDNGTYYKTTLLKKVPHALF